MSKKLKRQNNEQENRKIQSIFGLENRSRQNTGKGPESGSRQKIILIYKKHISGGNWGR